jgi:hypothetical protein
MLSSSSSISSSSSSGSSSSGSGSSGSGSGSSAAAPRSDESAHAGASAVLRGHHSQRVFSRPAISSCSRFLPLRGRGGRGGRLQVLAAVGDEETGGLCIWDAENGRLVDRIDASGHSEPRATDVSISGGGFVRTEKKEEGRGGGQRKDPVLQVRHVDSGAQGHSGNGHFIASLAGHKLRLLRFSERGDSGV